jgi:hypothetical protein
MSLLNFDASTVAPAAPNDPLPSGWYTCYMSASETKPTSSPGGFYLEAEYTVIAPPEFAKRKLFDRINLQNANPVAVEIGYRQLSAICHAVGVIQVQDSSQLHNRPLMVKASLRPAQTAAESADGKPHDASNDVKGYKAVDGSAAMGQPAPAPAMAPPAQWAPQAPMQQAPSPTPPPQWTPPPVQQAPQQAPQPPMGQQPPAMPWANQAAQVPQAPAQAPQQPAPASPPWAPPAAAGATMGQPGAAVPPWAK